MRLHRSHTPLTISPFSPPLLPEGVVRVGLAGAGALGTAAVHEALAAVSAGIGDPGTKNEHDCFDINSAIMGG